MTDYAAESTSRPAVTLKLMIGLFLAGLGIVLTADNLGIIDGAEILRWWSVVLIVIGLAKLRQPGSRMLAILLIVVGAWILAYNLGIFVVTLFDLWPLALVIFGLSLVSRAFRGGGAPRPVEGGNSRSLAVLSTVKIAPVGRWEGGRAIAVLGGCEIDLTRAEIGDPPPVIETLAFWGGVRIFVPSGWNVVGEVAAAMGGYESKIAPAGDTKREVIVRGLALMGGVEVKNG